MLREQAGCLLQLGTNVRGIDVHVMLGGLQVLVRQLFRNLPGAGAEVTHPAGEGAPKVMDPEVFDAGPIEQAGPSAFDLSEMAALALARKNIKTPGPRAPFM